MSRSESDSESDSSSKHLRYCDRPEWSDVVPIEQDDGPNAVVKIAYSEAFRDTFDYLRACMHKNELSERALELTKSACHLNPANYTVWCYRRKILLHLGSDLDEELAFVGRMIELHPKNYQVWEHRRLIVEISGHSSNELSFIASTIKLDSKNYHAWQYRQWVLKTYALWSDELHYVDHLLQDDIRNNSAWNQRYFVIAHTTGFKDDVIERELDYVEKRIELYPDNESAWNYLRGIARFRLASLTDQRIWNFCRNLYENHFLKDEFNNQQWRFLLGYMIELLMDDDRVDKQEDNKKMIHDLCEKLMLQIDPIRKKYWQYIEEQMSTNHAFYTEKTTEFSGNDNKVAIVNTFYNVIAQDGADPWVYKHTDGWYYSTRTTGGDVRIWRSRTFTSMDAGESRVVWRSSNSGPACRDIWAPEIHFLKSSWYIYFAATTCDSKNENHRMFVIENTNADPFTDSFTWKGQITDATNKWAIDGTVLDHPSGQLYFIWSGWEGNVNERQILYIAQMSNPWTISSPRVEIARPIYNWELNHRPYINEGPQVTIRSGVISLVYSASGSWTNDYCLGLITAHTSSNPMLTSSWQKRANPIFRSANSVYGPGHQSFTKSPDNQEDWIIYHSARYSGSGWTRQIRAQQFTWNTDSTPNLGTPVNPNIPIRVPSGDQNRDRYEAEHARLLNGPYVHPHASASNGLKVGYIDYPDSTVEFTIQCSKAGTYIIVIRNGNGSAGNSLATHWLTINNVNPTEVPIVYSGWDMWGATMVRANLKQGANTLSFKKGLNFAEIDMVDVFLGE
ncbi:unnamed protein product [Rotaria socialis]|uniref:CBM6 domain-containing protein n=1 Tax=Rotaria socialis TaxID=392032 RepID=A0A818RQA1_9BILA|nr:unnamed protein product [Rotaria socialis]CAF4269273.1 unnamed protein product [Rotaria socialis]